MTEWEGGGRRGQTTRVRGQVLVETWQLVFIFTGGCMLFTLGCYWLWWSPIEADIQYNMVSGFWAAENLHAANFYKARRGCPYQEQDDLSLLWLMLLSIRVSYSPQSKENKAARRRNILCRAVKGDHEFVEPSTCQGRLQASFQTPCRFWDCLFSILATNTRFRQCLQPKLVF